MEFFGVTLSGYGNYISEIIRKGIPNHWTYVYCDKVFAQSFGIVCLDYKEPNKLPNIKEILEERLRLNPRLSFSEAYNKLDPILGTGSGFSYGSHQRLRLQIKKGLTKPVGPTEMYRIPATTGQDWGFWENDELLKNANWTRITANYKMKSSELAKYAPVL